MIPFPGIISSGNDVTVSDSDISNNSTTGILARGDVTISSSTISGNTVGGIRAGEDVTIRFSTVVGNGDADSGPGVAVFGSLILENNFRTRLE